MTSHIGDRLTAAITGSVGLVFSIAYVLHALSIEDSLLADAVGASGVPVGIGVLMGCVCCALLFKALIQPGTPAAAATPSTATQSNPGSDAKAIGLLAILIAYVLLLPFVGYVISIGLLTFAVAWFAGARNKGALAGLLFLTGPLLWLLFAALLKVRLPTGIWSALLSG